MMERTHTLESLDPPVGLFAKLPHPRLRNSSETDLLLFKVAKWVRILLGLVSVLDDKHKRPHAPVSGREGSTLVGVLSCERLL